MARHTAAAGSCPLMAAQQPEASAAHEQSHQRSLVIKSRKSNRAFRLDRTTGAQLIDCLGEFFASRNVINRSDRYEQIQDERAPVSTATGSSSATTLVRDKFQRKKVIFPVKQKPHQLRFDTSWQSIAPVDAPSNLAGREADVWPAAPFHLAPGGTMNERHAGQKQQVKKFAHGGPPTHKQALGRKCGVYDLLKELLSGRRRVSKLLVLARLLKAPVVLAALFSFCLAVSLIVLYALSFHHCQQQRTKQQQQQQLNESENRPHLINSRQLIERESSVEFVHLDSEAIGSGWIDSSEAHARDRVVHTECGSFEARDDGAQGLVFAGIPYASPPVEQRRWQRPQPIWRDAERCKKGARVQQEAREHCVQLSPFNRRVSGSEDCLYLDIYAPKNATRQLLPVMLYIHGGFLAYGSNGAASAQSDREQEAADQVNWLRARPSGQLASELSVLLVAANFRLQALGFMALEQLAANGSEPSAANFGLWDQLVALRWVARNIGAFGGDPANINLFGPDSASALPLALAGRRSRGRGQWAPPTNEATSKGPDGPALEAAHKLLRSVWLMNPSVYFELPHERAKLHYARLIKSQSICSNELPADGPLAGRQGAAGPQKDELALANNLVPAKRRQQQRLEALKTGNKSSDKSLRDCLMSLAASEVVREYLGQDDADFRLDDQNSLPIRNIYPDQFVTLDGELVQRSFPFADELATATDEHSASARPPELGSSERVEIDFLLGSSSQAVEFWSCPRNLHNWTWLDFERYVETSLNSFSQDAFRRATRLYGIPASAQKARLNLTGSPAEAYLTLVSDIRQICPANELAGSLGQLSSGRVGRYVIEWRPSERLARSLSLSSPMMDRAAAGSNRSQIDAPSRRVEYAFHQWDLLAFFGFHFERPHLDVQPADLEFQRQLRSMVRNFVWSRVGSSSHSLLFGRSHQVEQLEASAYKKRECQMWQQTLKQSYAWLS